jgi:hypothetical protein
MPIVDPGAIWEVDSARDHAKAEFSHSLDPLRSLVPLIPAAAEQSWRSSPPGLRDKRPDLQG